MNDISLPSPDGKHYVLLKFEGEIRYGPTYNTVHVDGVQLAEVIAGDEVHWLSKELVAIQEWMTTAERFGPNTCLLLIDVTKGMFHRAPVFQKGFVSGFKLVDDEIRYQKTRFGWSGQKEIEEVVLGLADIRDWKPLF